MIVKEKSTNANYHVKSGYMALGYQLHGLRASSITVSYDEIEEYLSLGFSSKELLSYFNKLLKHTDELFFK